MKLILLLILSLPVWGVEEPESEAMRALRLSCEKHRVGLGCFNYANMLNRKGTGEPDKYFDLGCKYQHSPSCSKEKWPEPESKTPALEPAPEVTSEVPPSTEEISSESEQPIPEESDASEELDSAEDESPEMKLENRISILPDQASEPAQTPSPAPEAIPLPESSVPGPEDMGEPPLLPPDEPIPGVGQ